VRFPNADVLVQELSHIDELKGKLDSQTEEDKLMKTVLQNDKSIIQQGNILNEAMNQGLHAFTPNLMFSQIVKNFQIAQNLYGEKLLKLLSGYSPDFIKKNLNIPEFQRDLRIKIEENIKDLQHKDLLTNQGDITDKGITLASLVLYTEELDHILPKGILGKKIHKKASHYGEKQETRNYRKGDRYRDFALKSSIKKAIRRKHTKLHKEDLQSFIRKSKGSVYIIYGLDASGSMKGEKLATAKKAGIALSYKATSEKDKVGLIVFGSDIKEAVHPTQNFMELLKKITTIRAQKETNFTKMIDRAVELFPTIHATKHLVILTDALPTVGEQPEEETLKRIAIAKNAGITISLIGINLDKKGVKFAKKITELGDGRLYQVKNLKDMDRIILEDYYSIF